MEPVDASGPNHKHRNSWRITTKKQELFFFPSLSLRPPQSFLPRNKRIKVKILLIEVWLSLPHPVTGDLRGRVGHFGVQMWILLFVCLRQRLPRGRGVDGGGRGDDEESVFFLRLPAFGAGDESERRRRCGCRCSNLRRSVSPRSGGTSVALLWASAVGWAVPVASRSGRNRHDAN